MYEHDRWAGLCRLWQVQVNAAVALRRDGLNRQHERVQVIGKGHPRQPT